MQTMNPARWADEAAAHQNLCQVCATFFLAPPSGQFLRAVASNPLTSWAAETDWNIEELELEFHALFRVPVGEHVFPYESCYRVRPEARPGQLMGKHTRDVLAFYGRAGFDLAPDNVELPDHAGLEFSFLEALAQREVQSWRDDNNEAALAWREMRGQFLAAHPAQWIPDLCAAIETKSEQPYFRSFASWISCVCEELDPARGDRKLEDVQSPGETSGGATLRVVARDEPSSNGTRT